VLSRQIAQRTWQQEDIPLCHRALPART
jgi:hypothetical protein